MIIVLQKEQIKQSKKNLFLIGALLLFGCVPSTIPVSYDDLAKYKGESQGVTIYVDGVAASTKILTDSLTGDTTTAESLLIGNQRTTSSFFFTGEMDDFRIFDFELTVGQVTSLFGS